jgi:hypothetical protein
VLIVVGDLKSALQVKMTGGISLYNRQRRGFDSPAARVRSMFRTFVPMPRPCISGIM